MEHADSATTWIRRWRLELARIALSLVVLAVAVALAVDPPAAWETSLFRAINDLTTWWGWVLWLIQQAGMVLAVPVAAVVLVFLVRHWRPPMTLLVGGILFSWAGTIALKEVFDRARPGELLADVNFGHRIPMTGLGFPSAHTAVAFTIAVVLAPYVPRWARWSLYGVAALVGLIRIYMGAHLPLDVLAGAAIGLVIGSVVNLASGIRVERAEPEAIHPR